VQSAQLSSAAQPGNPENETPLIFDVPVLCKFGTCTLDAVAAALLVIHMTRGPHRGPIRCRKPTNSGIPLGLVKQALKPSSMHPYVSIPPSLPPPSSFLRLFRRLHAAYATSPSPPAVRPDPSPRPHLAEDWIAGARRVSKPTPPSLSLFLSPLPFFPPPPSGIASIPCSLR
jgi:hypothetical protein